MKKFNDKINIEKFKKLDQTQWENIEIPITDFERAVCNVMKSIGKNSSKDIIIDAGENLQIIGEEIYTNTLRPILTKNSFLETISYENRLNDLKETNVVDSNSNKTKSKIDQKNKKNVNIEGKLMNKEEQMLFNTNKEKLEKKLNNLIDNYKIKDKSCSQNYEIEKENILEFKLIILIFIAKNYIKSYTLTNRESYLEAIIGFSTILKRLNQEYKEYDHKKKNNNDKMNQDRKNNKNLLLLKNKNANNNTANSSEINKDLNQEKSQSKENSKDIKYISHITKKSDIFSYTCLKDFENILTSIKTLANYDALEILTNYPKLMISNIITERYFKLKYIKAFNHQIELIDILRDSFSEFNSKLNIFKIKANLIFLKTPLGSGKTTIALAIASLIDEIRLKTEINEYALIFACSIEIVREYVGRIAYNSNVSFGVATSYYKDVKIVNSWSCKNVKNINLIITDFKTACAILNKNKKKNYILFIDEPTNKADNRKSGILKSFCDLFRNAPPNTILSSATLPSIDKMIPFQNYFKYINYHNALITNISSGHSLIGCQINCLTDFQSYFPHHCCKDKNELFTVYRLAFDDPLLSRFYNSIILVDMFSKMKKFFPISDDDKIQNYTYDLSALSNDSNNSNLKIPNIEKFFEDIDNINYSKVVEKCKELIRLLIVRGDNEIIRKVCECDSEFCCKNYKRNSNYKQDNEKSEEYLNYLPTKFAKYFGGGCLIISNQPFEFAKRYFFDFYQKIIEKLEENIINYLKSLSDYQASIKFIKNKKISEKEKEYEISKLKQVSFFSIPIDYVINSFTHFKNWESDTFGSINKLKIKKFYNSFNPDNFIFKKPPILEDIDLQELIEREKNVELIALLFGGVGIFNKSNPDISDTYNRLVDRFAQDKQLSYIISDINITYGANLSLNNIIVDDSYNNTNQININKLFQIIGRAGRIGQSWSAFAYLDESLIFLIDYKIRENYFKENLISDLEKNEYLKEDRNKNRIDLNSSYEEDNDNPFLTLMSDNILEKNLNNLINLNEIESKNLVYAFTNLNKFDFKFDKDKLDFKKHNKKSLVIFNPDNLQIMLGILMVKKFYEYKISCSFGINNITEMALLEFIPIETEEQLSIQSESKFFHLLKDYSKIYLFDIEQSFFKKYLLPLIYNHCDEIVYFMNDKFINNRTNDSSNITIDNLKKFDNLKIINDKGDLILDSICKVILEEKYNLQQFFEYQKNLFSKINSRNRGKIDFDEDDKESNSDKENSLSDASDENDDVSTQFNEDINEISFSDWKSKFEYLQNVCLEFYKTFFYSKTYYNKNYISQFFPKFEENNNYKNENFYNETNNMIKKMYETKINILYYLKYQVFRLQRSNYNMFENVTKKLFIENQQKLEIFGEDVKERYNFPDFIKKNIKDNIFLYLFNNQNLIQIKKLQENNEPIMIDDENKDLKFKFKIEGIKKKLIDLNNLNLLNDNQMILLGLNLEKIYFKNAYYLQIREFFNICDYLNIERKIMIISKCKNPDLDIKYKIGLIFSGYEQFCVDKFLEENKIKFIGDSYSAKFLIKKDDIKGWKII